MAIPAEAPATTKVGTVYLDHDQVERFLPHRHPALLILGAAVGVEDEEIVAEMDVAAAHSMCGDGHFPEKPIVMGALTLEAVQQAAALLALFLDWHKSEHRELWQAPMVLAREITACFNGMIQPDDQVTIAVKINHTDGRYASFSGCAKVGERVVANVPNLVGASLRAKKH